MSEFRLTSFTVYCIFLFLFFNIIYCVFLFKSFRHASYFDKFLEGAGKKVVSTTFFNPSILFLIWGQFLPQVKNFFFTKLFFFKKRFFFCWIFRKNYYFLQYLYISRNVKKKWNVLFLEILINFTKWINNFFSNSSSVEGSNGPKYSLNMNSFWTNLN